MKFDANMFDGYRNVQLKLTVLPYLPECSYVLKGYIFK